MPKLPDTGRRKVSLLRLFGALGVGLLAGLAGAYLWSPAKDVALGSRESDDSLAVAESFGAGQPDDPFRDLEEEGAAGAPRPGSMQEKLLNTADADRNHLFRRAIADIGYECSDVRDASAVGSNGSAWRANCGDTNLYFIEVGEYGRFTVVPMRFDDGLTPSVPRLEFKESE